MFLQEPPETEAVAAMYAGDRDAGGYVDNLTRLWAWRPDVNDAFTAARAAVVSDSALSDDDRAVLVVAAAAARGDSYCSLAWGRRLAGLTDPATAASVIERRWEALESRAAALAAWADAVVRDPNATSPDDVARLRSVGLDDRAVLEATVFVALRLAFSTVNDALGARPDRQLVETSPREVVDAVTYGRSPADEPSV